jgi:transcriptional regulator with XRE-family HTH domain
MATTLARRLGARVRALRKARGLTQEQLAERAGISAHFVSALERGVKGATLETLAALSTAFEITLSEMLLAVDRSPPRELARIEAAIAGRSLEVQRRILRLVEDALRIAEA